MVANGEIYNHEDLRSRLDGPFATDSDSEVVLHVIDRLGTDGIHDMRGMYAFCTATRHGTSCSPGTRSGSSRCTGPGTTTG